MTITNPDAMTPAEVVDALNAKCVALVTEKNAGRAMTADQFAAAVARVFDVAFPVFLEHLVPEHRAEFLAALDEQMTAEHGQ
ncbi:hypothetical protein ACWELJ_25895 [Nocardia sp. NPDC004582]